MITIKDYVESKKLELKNNIRRFGLKPRLAVIQVGDDPASNSYIRGKEKDCEEVGIRFKLIKLPENITQAQLREELFELNMNRNIHGIIVQLPLPKHLDVKEIQKLIYPAKDVDGFRQNSPYEPCTPLGVINYLKANNYEFRGKNACVIGRSDIVGKPLARMLLDLDCTVTICHSYSDLDMALVGQQLVFTCINKIEYFNADTFMNTYYESTIIDIGLGRGKDGKLHGNLSPEAVKHLREDGSFVVSGIGGVGLLTRLELLNNTYKAAVRAD